MSQTPGSMSSLLEWIIHSLLRLYARFGGCVKSIAVCFSRKLTIHLTLRPASQPVPETKFHQYLDQYTCVTPLRVKYTRITPISSINDALLTPVIENIAGVVFFARV